MDYNVRPIGKTCAATGEELVPGTVCISALIDEEGRLVRRDYSQGGWNGPPENMVGYWKATVPAAEEPAERVLDPDAMMSYFEQLSEELNPAQEKLRYVLALLLLQKRRLQLTGSQMVDDFDCLVFVGNRGEGQFEVRDQQLSEEEIEQLQSNLSSYAA